MLQYLTTEDMKILSEYSKKFYIGMSIISLFLGFVLAELRLIISIFFVCFVAAAMFTDRIRTFLNNPTDIIKLRLYKKWLLLQPYPKRIKKRISPHSYLS